MGTLNLAAYKPVPSTPGDANQIANGFTAIETSVNGIAQTQMAAGNKITQSALSGGPPASPADGDIWIATGMVNGVLWQFRYNAGSGSGFKWEFLGGSPIDVTTGASESTASNVNVDLATVQSITLTRAGDYRAEFGADCYATVSNGNLIVVLVKNGVEQYNAIATPGASNSEFSIGTSVPLTVAAADVLKLQFRVSAGVTGQFLRRTFMVTPVRIA